MENIYFGYMTESERADLIEESTLNNEFEKLNMLYEMRSMQYEQNCRDAELKVLSESGTYDDLQFLLETAGNEAAEQKKGILSRIGEALKTLWKAIKEAFNKVFNIKGQDEVKMPENEFKALQKLSEMKDEIDGITSDIASGNYASIGERVKKILPVIGVVGAIGGTAAAGVKLYKTSKDEINGLLKPVKTAVDAIADGIDTLLAKINNFATKIGGEKPATDDNTNKPAEQNTNTATPQNTNTATPAATTNSAEPTVKNEAAGDGNEQNSNKLLDFAKAALNKLQELGKALRAFVGKIASYLTKKIEGTEKTTPTEGNNPEQNQAQQAQQGQGEQAEEVEKFSPAEKGDDKRFTYSSDKKYRIDNKGAIYVKGENGIYVGVVDTKTLPDKVRRGWEEIKAKSQKATEEGVDVELDINEIRNILGKGYLVECTEEYIEITEAVEISRHNSIFGSLVEADLLNESANSEDEHAAEMARLTDLINSL